MASRRRVVTRGALVGPRGTLHIHLTLACGHTQHHVRDHRPGRRPYLPRWVVCTSCRPGRAGRAR